MCRGLSASPASPVVTLPVSYLTCLFAACPGPIFHYYLPMDTITAGGMVEGRGIAARTHRAASQVEGKVGGAVLLSGSQEYLDLGDVTHTCLGDLDLCRYGLYVSMWVQVSSVEGGRKPLLSSPAVGLYQEGPLLIARANVSTWRERRGREGRERVKKETGGGREGDRG